MTDAIRAGDVTVQPGGLLEVPHRFAVGFARDDGPRRRCSTCSIRRVLYRIVAATPFGGDITAARCFPCWTGGGE
jgi:hypothetical protein